MPLRPTLILASASPRRRQLLALGGWDFEVCAVPADETPLPGERAEDCVLRLSRAKAQMAAPSGDHAALVIAADTTVTIDGHILNKPADAQSALRMLRQLRGREHEVLTGLTVLDTQNGALFADLARSRVPMRRYDEAEISAYVASGDPLDKAGAYAIQHSGFQPVDKDRFRDCFANVMGLPLCHLLRRLRRLGVDAPADLPAACQRFIPYRCPVFEKILSENA